MAKPNPLAQGLEALSKPAPEANTRQPREPKGSTAPRTPSREGQILVGGFFAPEVHRQLKVLAAETGATQQNLLAEALNMVFSKYGKPEIALLGRTVKTSE